MMDTDAVATFAGISAVQVWRVAGALGIGDHPGCGRSARWTAGEAAAVRVAAEAGNYRHPAVRSLALLVAEAVGAAEPPRFAAVGVSPDGAQTWTGQDVVAVGAHVARQTADGQLVRIVRLGPLVAALVAGQDN